MQPRLFIGLVFLGVYLNIVAFGFHYGVGNHTSQLSLVNWLINPALYPDDLFIKAYARYPTFYWLAIAYASHWFDTLYLVFASFIVTKVLFFAAITRLVGQFLNNHWVLGCVIGSIALSPLLNDQTPFAYSDILNPVQTQTSLVIALLIWVHCFLLERRWLIAGIVLGLSVYVNVLFATYTLFAFVGFTLLDWEKYKHKICIASAAMIVISVPWLVLSESLLQHQIPENYVETLLMQFPFHISLSSHSAYDMLRGLGILIAAACITIVATKLRIARANRLEWLAGFFVIPVVLGSLVGEIFPVPSLIRPQFLRADSFLVLYAIILVQVYGGRILLSMPTSSSPARLALGMSAILFPLFLPALLFAFFPLASWLILMVLIGIMTGQFVYPGVVCLLTTGLTVAWFSGLTGVPARLTASLALISGLFVAWQLSLRRISIKSPVPTAALRSFFKYWNGASSISRVQKGLVPGIAGLVLISAMIGTIPTPSRLWNPVVSPGPFHTVWHEIQHWAKVNTPLETKFLVPPSPVGFRMFSERTSWVDWKDGGAMWTLPEFATEWRRRMNALGIQLVAGEFNPTRMVQQYKQQSWEHLATIARAHNLDYIIQYAEVQYHLLPVFKNKIFAVYKVPE